MPRPKKFRRVEFFPDDNYFIPFGKKKCEVDDVVLKIEELEAIRLKDIENLSQEDCAEKMHVSRQTFQNIVNSARKKIAIALTLGKAIHISGGHYTSKFCQFKCLDCEHEFDIQTMNDESNCPSCSSTNIICLKKSKPCRKWCNK